MDQPGLKEQDRGLETACAEDGGNIYRREHANIRRICRPQTLYSLW